VSQPQSSIKPFPIRSLLIANRGEIALRVARTARRLGIEVLGVFSSADTGLPHLRLCHRALELQGDPSRVYLDIPKVVAAAKQLGAHAVHPGYGFLSENEDFAAAIQSEGMLFVGPTPEQIVALGDKVAARQAAMRAGVPVVPGQETENADTAALHALAAKIGYPVLVKAAGGGGGRGMRVVQAESELDDAVRRAQNEAQLAFGDPRVFIEKFIARARHVEVQVFGDGKGKAVALGERDCSIQRRHQKLIEESPSPAITPETRAKLCDCAARLAASVNYRGAGTMEFIVPLGAQDFYFIEMNTRLQVEHPVTELCTGLDLVEEQLVVASGVGFSARLAAFNRERDTRGHAIEARVIAEDSDADFRPSCGPLQHVQWPSGPGIRVDAWAEAGLEVSPYYDSLLGKVLAFGATRDEAIGRLNLALRETLLFPVRSTANYLADLISADAFRTGDFDTGTVDRQRAEKKSAPALPERASLLAAAELRHRTSNGNGAAPRPQPRALSAWQNKD